MIKDNITRILSRIEAVCRPLGRNPEEIVLVGVTKNADLPQINEALGCGLTHVGENKVQEAWKKYAALEISSAKVTKHMIGHLQTNKVRQALEAFDMLQTVDSIKLASVIDAQAAKIRRNIDILVQVNISGEEQKYGIAPDGVLPLLEKISVLKHLRLHGLMTIAPLCGDKEIIRKCFRDLRLLYDKINSRFLGVENIRMQYLSMGMTDDFEIALEEGSNMVRIGRAIFEGSSI
jgi:pyridoxal phosphate enzyme (YggS family)